MRKILSMLLTIAMLASLVILPVNAAGSVTPIEGVMWEYDNATKVITFTGTGPIPDFEVTEEGDNRPWAKFAQEAEAVVIGEGITAVGNNIFNGFTAVTAVTLPEGITDIGDNAFFFCPIAEIKFPSTLKTIGDNAFGFAKVAEIVLPDGVETVGEEAFANSAVTKMVLPESVTAIGKAAFNGCTKLVGIMIPSAVTVIEDNLFHACSSLEYVSLPGGITSIGMYAFSGCSSLANITIPDSVSYIGDHAFSSCYGLTDVRLPASLSDTGICVFGYMDLDRIIVPDTATGIDGATLAYIKSLGELVISADNPNYVIEDGILYNGDKSVIIYCLDREITSVTLGDGIVAVGDYAFNDVASLKSVILNDGLKTIGVEAFRNTSINSVRVPAGVESIGDAAFAYCENANVILVAGAETAVGESAFILTEPKGFLYAHEGSSAQDSLVESGEGRTFVSVDNELGYLDVTASKWSYAGIDFAVNNGLFRGMSTMYFMPEVKMNRAMLVTVLHRLEGEPAASEEYELPFTDVDEKGYYYEALRWAAENGIINGTSETTFSPSDYITREQMVTVLYRYAGAAAAEDATLDAFVDGEDVSAYAVDAMKWAVAEGIITGMGAADALSIAPKGEATRAQVATIFQRFCTEDETVEPEEPTEPSEPEEPSDPEEPSEPETPTDPEEPSEPETPAEPEA